MFYYIAYFILKYFYNSKNKYNITFIQILWIHYILKGGEFYLYIYTKKPCQF